MPTRKTQKGINKAAKLARHVLNPEKLKQVPTRNGYGEGLVEAGKANKNVVVLCADLTESTRSHLFKEAFPDRFVQVGISEQAMASMAAGMALSGKVPFISSYAAFSPGRNWEMIKTNGCMQEVPLKVAGAHAGLSVGPDGGTHQMLEDVALTRVLPHMEVVVPCDYHETRRATVAVAKTKHPSYVRFARAASPVFTTNATPFKIGRGEVYRFGDDVTVVGAGPVLYEALIAAERLAECGMQVRVINMHTVKPLDVKLLVKAARETGAIVTVEEAQAAGGLGGAVCEALSAMYPVPVERVGVQDRFGESGEPHQVLEALGLSAEYIEMAIERAYRRKMGEHVPVVPRHVSEPLERLEALRKTSIKQAMSRPWPKVDC